MSIPSQDQIDAAVSQTMDSMTREEMEEMLNEALAQQTGVNTEELADYISSMTDEEFNSMFTQIIAEQFTFAICSAGTRTDGADERAGACGGSGYGSAILYYRTVR